LETKLRLIYPLFCARFTGLPASKLAALSDDKSPDDQSTVLQATT